LVGCTFTFCCTVCRILRVVTPPLFQFRLPLWHTVWHWRVGCTACARSVTKFAHLTHARSACTRYAVAHGCVCPVVTHPAPDDHARYTAWLVRAVVPTRSGLLIPRSARVIRFYRLPVKTRFGRLHVRRSPHRSLLARVRVLVQFHFTRVGWLLTARHRVAFVPHCRLV